MDDKKLYQEYLTKCTMLSDEELDALIMEHGLKMNDMGQYDSGLLSQKEHHLMWLAAIEIQGRRGLNASSFS